MKRQYVDYAILKYDLEPTILWLGPSTLVDDMERYYIAKLDTVHPKGYNLERGGCKYKEASESTRQKISQLKSGSNNPNYGTHRTEEDKR